MPARPRPETTSEVTRKHPRHRCRNSGFAAGRTGRHLAIQRRSSSRGFRRSGASHPRIGNLGAWPLTALESRFFASSQVALLSCDHRASIQSAHQSFRFTVVRSRQSQDAHHRRRHEKIAASGLRRLKIGSAFRSCFLLAKRVKNLDSQHSIYESTAYRANVAQAVSIVIETIGT